MTKALKHTDGRIITVNFGELKWSNKTGDDYAHEREGYIQATMYQNGAQALRDANGTLTEWERVQTKNYNFAEVMSLLTMTTDLPIGEAIQEIAYDFLLTKVGDGWIKI